MLKKIF